MDCHSLLQGILLTQGSNPGLLYCLQILYHLSHHGSPTISQSLPKFMSIESVILSNYLILCCPLLLFPSIFPSIRVFSSEWALCIRCPKCWSFNFSISPSSEYSEFISLDWLVWSPCSPRESQEFSPVQFKSMNSSVLSFLYSPTLTSTHDYWKKT